MPRTYDIANPEVLPYIELVIADTYPELRKLDLKYDCLFASSDSPDTPAVTAGGYPAAAVIKIVNLEDRIKGNGDVQIKIDRDHWDGLDNRARHALLDHELCHILPVKDQAGAFRCDDAGRPRLRLRKHDVQVGWFVEVAKRWGSHSAEVRQAKQIFDKYGQALFPFIIVGLANNIVPMTEGYGSIEPTRKAS